MELSQYMEKAFYFEENGYAEEAIQLCSKCMQAFPEYSNEIEFEIAKMNYRNGNLEEALIQFYELFELTGNKEIAELILDAYYDNHLQEYVLCYENNCKELERYAYYFGDKSGYNADSARYYPLLAGGEHLYYYDSVNMHFLSILQPQIDIDNFSDSVCLLAGICNLDDILAVEQKTRKINPIMDNENPLLLVYEEDIWELFLQLSDISVLLSFDRIFLFNSPEQLEKAITSGITHVPNILAGNGLGVWKKTVADADEKMQLEYAKYGEELCQYYRNHAQDVLRHIDEGKPRIMFLTSRYTTALQYHARDCREAAERMGIETEYLIEPNRFVIGIPAIIMHKALMEFKPDIFFVINHFRFEYAVQSKLEQAVFIGWVQDPMTVIMDKQAPEKLGPRDIIMTHYITWKGFQEVGYDKKRVIDAPIPANPYLYKKYSLTAAEKEKYSCDICFVCHNADVDGYIENEIKIFPEMYRKPLYEIYKGYQEYVLRTGHFFETEDECRQFLEGALQQHYGIKFFGKALQYISENFFLRFNEVVFRQVLADWLLAAGYENIKLWGKGWKNDSKYAKYAMGPAENGETLSKIYQASKIVVGNNFHASASARAWESMMSGAFYMSNYIPPERDAVDIRMIMKEDEELVIFHGKEDFLNKVEYYLTHEEERIRMAEIGQKAALERMTYDILMKRVVEGLPERLRMLGQGENTNGR